jgi:hypothetical protein
VPQVLFLAHQPPLVTLKQVCFMWQGSVPNQSLVAIMLFVLGEYRSYPDGATVRNRRLISSSSGLDTPRDALSRFLGRRTTRLPPRRRHAEQRRPKLPNK